MKSREIRGLVLLASGVAAGFLLAAGAAVVAGRGPALPRAGRVPADDRLVAEVLERIRAEYVEPVADGQLAEGAVRGMLATLDPHSQFLDADAHEEVRINASGNYTGVGLEVQVRDGQVVVVAPIAGSAAHRAGLGPGDVIVSVDGMPVAGDLLEEAILRLRGDAGTTVVVSALRQGQGTPRAVPLRREPVHVHSVVATPLVDNFGYVRVSRFNDTTARDLHEAVDGLRRRAGGLQGLVLDLRDNPGGVLDAAVAVADAFLDDGVIVSASGRTADATFRHAALRGDLLEGAPLAVLVNGASASAAEIVAGALRDHGRATLLGAQTFGKGSVQTVLPLSGGRAVKLTTSRYFTPSGESIQDRGITPDVLLQGASPAASGPGEDPQVKAALAALARGSRPATRLLLTSRFPEPAAPPGWPMVTSRNDVKQQP